MFNGKKKDDAVQDMQFTSDTPIAEIDESVEIVSADEIPSESSISNVTIDEEGIFLDIVEVDDVNFSAMGYMFDEETDTVIVDEESFSTMVDKDGLFTIEEEVINEKGKKVKKKRKVKARKGKRKVSNDIGTMREENFGDLLPFIKDINITDINWNGLQLWVDDVNKGRYCVEDIQLSKDFVETFSIRVSNTVSGAFNKYHPRLEAETDELRITVLHESVSHTGRAISIRKTPAVKRINFIESIKNGSYCSEEVSNIMSNAIKAKMNVVIVGLPGVGKTELVKFLTNYIFPRDRAITVEDTLELHYADINPGKDCIEMKVNENLFTYTDAIKVSLRLLPQWILLSEARSVEVKYLLESVSTGSKCITTLHTDDVRKIPDRVVHMMGDVSDIDATLDSIYSFFDFGIMINKSHTESGGIRRWIDQICYFDRVDGQNKCTMLVNNGELTGETFSEDFMHRFNRAGIRDPFKYTFI